MPTGRLARVREPGRGGWRAERDAGLGLAFTLAVAVPTLVVAEDWHGRPLIDQGGLGWLVPGVLVASAFAVGGAIAGRRWARLGSATGAGLVVGALGVLLLIAADGARRMLVNPTLPMGVVDYWLEGAAASLFLAVVGAIIGNRLGARAAARHEGRPPSPTVHPAPLRSGTGPGAPTVPGVPGPEA